MMSNANDVVNYDFEEGGGHDDAEICMCASSS